MSSAGVIMGFLPQSKYMRGFSWLRTGQKTRKTTEKNCGGKKTLHNSWPDQEHSPGGWHISVKVNNQEKTSPEKIQMVHHKMLNIGEPQNIKK